MPLSRNPAPVATGGSPPNPELLTRGRLPGPAEMRASAARARRAEVALVSSYLRALRRVGEVPLAARDRITGLRPLRRVP